MAQDYDKEIEDLRNIYQSDILELNDKVNGQIGWMLDHIGVMVDLHRAKREIEMKLYKLENKIIKDVGESCI